MLLAAGVLTLQNHRALGQVGKTRVCCFTRGFSISPGVGPPHWLALGLPGQAQVL